LRKASAEIVAMMAEAVRQPLVAFLTSRTTLLIGRTDSGIISGAGKAFNIASRIAVDDVGFHDLEGIL
jgi:hypothetical protein